MTMDVHTAIESTVNKFPELQKWTISVGTSRLLDKLQDNYSSEHSAVLS
ncbi:MAG: hypothetical protein ACRCXC_05480 [Legionella sp.]